ncbi:MAG TPA: SRPBCC domain-containing protein [Anaerolineaceae bacterium]|nr:SRPBCC domain-containing protein [Anaerolineaceae bacterium]HPN49966.1 SRPBCC domain-containing protein [Anaerolineaceae bacterium]
MPQIRLTCDVRAPIETVYQAFTNATALREWMCDVATFIPSPEGRVYFWWPSGFYACGTVLSAEPHFHLAYSWLGKGNPASSMVEIYLKAGRHATHVTLVQKGMGRSETWQRICREMEEGWKKGLENLISVLETGIDLRIARRPMMGVVLSDFNADIAAALGIPVHHGVRLEDAREGFGAFDAGLRKNDVLVQMGDTPIQGYDSLGAAIQGYQAGDEIEIKFYRGSELLTTQMVFSARKMPEAPATLVELVEAVKKIKTETRAGLLDLLRDVTDAEAAFKPAENEWSIKEIICHLIHVERDILAISNDILSVQEKVSDGFADNNMARILATLAAHPTLPELLDAFAKSELETIIYLDNLPPHFIARKAGYYRVAIMALDLPSHTQSHFDQIKANLELARAAR